MRNMHVNARLFARKEEEAKLTVTNNGWCHVDMVTNLRSSRLTFELSERQRHGSLDSKRKMGRRPSA
jgi:hypothetical protein